MLDLSDTRLVDHTVMAKLSELKRQFADSGRRLEVVGLHNHKPLSRHPDAARRRVDSAESLS